MNSEEKLKIGLDLHGVITKYPDKFRKLATVLIGAGHEVHIITGAEKDEILEAKLKKYNVPYSHLFSVTSHLISEGEDCRRDKNGEPWFDKSKWESAKGIYCVANKIDMHFDDSGEYKRYFDLDITQFIKVD